MGTDKEDFIQLTERIGRKTGGVGVSSFTSDIRGQEDPAAYLIVRGKAVADKTSDLTDLFVDILHNARLDDQARFKQVRRAKRRHQRECCMATRSAAPIRLLAVLPCRLHSICVSIPESLLGKKPEVVIKVCTSQPEDSDSVSLHSQSTAPSCLKKPHLDAGASRRWCWKQRRGWSLE